MDYQSMKDKMQEKNGMPDDNKMAINTKKGVKFKDLNKLPGNTMQEKIERALRRPLAPGESLEKAIQQLKESKKLVN
jgi:hypothetical protein